VTVSIHYTAKQLVEQFGGRLAGDPEKQISSLGTLELATEDCLGFLANPKYREQLRKTKAGVVLVSDAALDAVPAHCTAIVTPNPYLYFAKVTGLFKRPSGVPGIHSSAVIDSSAIIGRGVHIAAGVVIGAGSTVGDGVSLASHVVIGENCQIGSGTQIYPNVSIYEGSRIGERCIIHSGVIIGADGFGFAPAGDAGWQKIEQLGRVIVGDDVEIGANTTIDRGTIEDTVIERGCKLDNQIQIAHNVRVGEFTVIAACVGVAGSATIGKRCMIGGAAGILGHLSIADGTTISAMSLVTRTLAEPGMYTGVYPLMSNRDWERSAVTVRKLDDLRDRVLQLEKQLAATQVQSQQKA
jgi:UDP-3-O-[3-hydroxymyristoyl] glucosamine N-acyltransferase